MKKAFAWILVAGILMLLGRSEEQRVLDTLERIRALAEVRGQEDTLAAVGVARELGTLFSARTWYDLTTLDYGITEIDSREELVRRIAAGRGKLSSLELDLLAPEVSIEGDHATVEVTGTALGTVRGEQSPFMDVHRVAIELAREDGDWRVRGGRHIRDERATLRGERWMH